MNLKIGVLKPNWGFISGDKSMHLWASEFIKRYCEKELTFEECKTYEGDMVIQVNGRPDLPYNCPPKEFKGIKVVHLQDHVFQVEKTKQILKENNVQYVMAYNRHDKYDPFFQANFPEYKNKVIGVPFGFNDKRFGDNKEFSSRKNKVIALGSVNPVSDPLCIADIEVYAKFNKHEEFTHKWRKMLVENSADLWKEMDSLLPVFPQTKNFDYDIVETYNNYKMFTSGESIMNYPSVKTFEGMACGSVLVCSDHQCYKDLGLINGLNCIMHKQCDIEDFKEQVSYYQHDQEALEKISQEGKRLVNYNYTPEHIAEKLFHNLETIWINK